MPHNPCSIAGMMSLLAESEMCKAKEVIPEGSEWMNEKELKRAGVFEGLVFWMGWWSSTGGMLEEEEDEKGRIFGIDVARKNN